MAWFNACYSVLDGKCTADSKELQASHRVQPRVKETPEAGWAVACPAQEGWASWDGWMVVTWTHRTGLIENLPLPP